MQDRGRDPQMRHRREDDGRTYPSHLNDSTPGRPVAGKRNPLPGSSNELPHQSPILWQPSNANRSRVFTRRRIPGVVLAIIILAVIVAAIVFLVMLAQGRISL